MTKEEALQLIDEHIEKGKNLQNDPTRTVDTIKSYIRSSLELHAQFTTKDSDNYRSFQNMMTSIPDNLRLDSTLMPYLKSLREMVANDSPKISLP